MDRVDNSHNAFIVALKLKAFTRKMGVPEGASDNNREKFLPFKLIPVFLLIRRCGGQCPWNHFPLKYTPNPMMLAASVYNSRSGEVTKESRRKDRPFHWVRKTFHMVISRWNCLFKWIW